MTTIELFLKLVRNALWQNEEELPEELSANMTANILRGGKEQGLLGLVTDALVRNKVRMPQEKQLETMVLLAKVKQGHEKVNEGLRRLKELFDGRGIDYVVVKGQAVGAYYPDSTLRQTGDIDYYCDAQNYPKAEEAIREEWNIDDGNEVDDHHVQYNYNEVTYEAHFSLIPFYSKKANSYWQHILDEDKGNIVTIEGMEVKTLSPTIHVLYVFTHLYSHLLKQGIGMRQFCDLAVMLHYCREEIDYDRLQEMLRTLGLEKAYRCICSILTDSLGMPPQDLGYELTDQDRRYAPCIFSIVRHRGNMGHNNLLYNGLGWLHSLELIGIKLAHFMKLWPLAPAYSCRWIAYEMTKKL